MSIKIELPKQDFNDIIKYCQLNKLDIVELSTKCFLEGYRIEKYGLLNSKDRIIEKEVIVEVPKIEYVEVEKPVEVIKEVIVEKVVEVVKEVIVEKPVEVIKEVIVENVVEVVKEVVVEKPVEVIKEVIVEKMVGGVIEVPAAPVEVIKYVDREVIKEVPVEVIKEVIIEKEQPDIKAKLDSLQQTLLKLRNEMLEKDKKIEEYQSQIKEFEAVKTQQATFLRGSNLNNKLY